MWRLTKAQVTGVRRAIDVQFEVAAPVVALHGATGAGKTSTLVGIGWGLAGEAVTDRGRLSQEQIRNTLHNAVVDLALVNDEGEVLTVMRTLTHGGGHGLFVDGQQYVNLGKASEALEGRLGVKLDQLGYLTSAHRLVELSGLEQAALLLGLMGPEITLESLDAMLGPDGAEWSAAGETEGWPLLQAALRYAETNRTEQGREAKRLRSDAEKAQAVAMERCREARVPGPPQIAGKLTQVGDHLARLEARLAAQAKALEAQGDYDRALSAQQAAQARAEVEVVAAKRAVAEADALREAREQQRAEAEEVFATAYGAYQAAREANASANNHAQAMEVVRDVLSRDFAQLEGAEKCHTCLRELTDECRGEVNKVLADAEKDATDARANAEKTRATFLDAQRRCEAAGEALEALPPIAPADALQAVLDAAVAASDAAGAAIEQLTAQGRPEAPTPQEVEAAQVRLEDLATQRALLENAQVAAERAQASAAQANEASHLYDRYGALVTRLREIVREVAAQAIGPVLETSNAMLAPRLRLGYDPEQGIVAVYGEEETLPIAELSTGERLEVGVSLQASIARALGVGICLVDDASVWDRETAFEMAHMMALLGCEHNLTWVVASAQEPDHWTDGNLQVVEIDGGYAV